MLNLARSWVAVLLLAMVAALALPSPSHANFTVTLKQESTVLKTFDFTDPGAYAVSGTYGDFKLAFTAVSSNSPGSSTQGLLQFSSLTVSNVSASSDVKTLTVEIEDKTFTSPGAPGTDMSLVNGLTVLYASKTATAGVQSFGNGTPTEVAEYTGGWPDGTKTTAVFSRPDSTYTLKQHLEINLGQGDNIMLQSTTAAAAVPEPSTVLLGLMGGVPLVAGALLRRRRPKEG
jgi:hypothetical protein